jgi:hypothetical protein
VSDARTFPPIRSDSPQRPVEGRSARHDIKPARRYIGPLALSKVSPMFSAKCLSAENCGDTTKNIDLSLDLLCNCD